jgi:hypothetical protein
MRKFAFLAVIALFGLAATGYAQNAATDLLDSPYKIEAEVSAAGETVSCSVLMFGGSGSLFGTDVIVPSGPPAQFLQDELFTPFRVSIVNEDCGILSTWSDAAVGFTQTGISYDIFTGGTYWVVWPFNNVTEYFLVPAGTPTGLTLALPAGTPGLFGPMWIDNNVAPSMKMWTEDIVDDRIYEIDMVTGPTGVSYSNPDNAGTGAYGNGGGDAKDLSVCGAKRHMVSSGKIGDGQVVRASQMDETGMGCYSLWDVATPTGTTGEFFVNGVEPFLSKIGTYRLAAAGNVTGLFFNIGQPIGIANCQGIDASGAVLFANADQGGTDQTVEINNTYPIGLAIQKPAAGGNGKFVVHLNAGVPSGGTITNLPKGLGPFCFPLLIPPGGSATPVCVWNGQIANETKVGDDLYFGAPFTFTNKAPTFLDNIDGNYIAAGDPANFTLLSQWTIQGVVNNPAASSAGHSVTNAFIIDVTTGI